jgi:exosortase/archaeosortase family protein
MTSDWAQRLHLRHLVAAAAGVVGVALLVFQHQVRRYEATASARAVSLFGLLHAHSIGTAVVFVLRGHFVGYSLSAGCTAAFLIAPFFLLAGAALVIAPRLPVGRTLSTLAMIAALLFVVNQARLLVIAGSMREWGFVQGYDVSHVFLGTVVSTIGVVGGLVLFLARVGFREPSRARS